MKTRVWLLKKVSENKAGLFAHSSLFEHDPKPEKLDDLRHISCILKPSDANGGVWILQHDQQQQKFSIQVNWRFNVNSIVDQLQAVKAGLCIVLLPYLLALVEVQ